MLRRLILVAVFGAFSAGAQLRVALPKPACSGDVVFADAAGVIISRKSIAPELQIPRSRPLRIALESPTCWSARLVLLQGQTDAELPVFPKASLTAQLELPPSSTGSPMVELLARSGTTSARFDCTLRDHRLACDGAAGEWVLELRGKNLAAKVLGPRTLSTAGPLDLGAVTLFPGATVRGHVTTEGKRISQVTVRLRGAVENEPSLPTLQAQTDSAGQFLIEGVPVGVYTLSAEQKGLVAAARRVAVTDPKLTEVGVLDMVAPATVNVYTTPPLAPDGTPWTVRIQERGSASDRSSQEYQADLAGVAQFTKMVPGEYVVTVTSETGSVLKREALVVRPGRNTLGLTVSPVAVRGSVYLGSRPVEATVTISHPERGRAVFRTDEGGRFSGLLPTPGIWPSVEIALRGRRGVIRHPQVEVVRREDGGDSDLDLRISGATVIGTVVDESGQSVRAVVAAMRDARELVSVITDDGAFELSGVPPGALQIRAMDENDNSGAVVVETNDDDVVDVRIIIRKAQKISGTVLSAAQIPIAGAVVRGFALGSNELRQTQTGPDGRFSMTFPGDASQVTLVAHADGFGALILGTRLPMNDVRVVLNSTPARLVIGFDAAPPWPTVRPANSSAAVPARLLHLPRPPSRLTGGAVLNLAPGAYVVCAPAQTDCREVSLVAFQVTRVDFSAGVTP